MLTNIRITCSFRAPFQLQIVYALEIFPKNIFLEIIPFYICYSNEHDKQK